MIQLPKNQFGAMAALTAITQHLDKQIQKADSSPGNNLSGGSNVGEGSNAKCGVKKSEMGTDHRTNPPPAQSPLHQECVIEVKRYGENGEPLFVQVLGCACYPTDLKTPNKQLVWTAYSEGEVVETNGSFRAGEVIQLSPEEQEWLSVEAEREYLRDDV